VILRTNHRLRWPPTFPSGTILQPTAREQAVMLLQAALLHGVALHINSRLHKNGPKCVGFIARSADPERFACC
jgi:hypothetical protein